MFIRIAGRRGGSEEGVAYNGVGRRWRRPVQLHGDGRGGGYS